jgi:ketosteroid isomerase-like protein
MSSKPYSDDEHDLRRLEMLWDDALAQRDAVTLSSLIADDYQVTDVDGQTRNKTKVLEAISSKDPRLKPYRRHDMEVRVSGNRAVVTGGITWNGSNGRTFHTNGNSNARYLKVYVKRGDVWQGLLAQAIRSEH